MELDEFISSTLSQIIIGVKDAQNQHGKLVNPASQQSRQGEVFKYVEFDVAVTVEENNGMDGKAKISVMGSGFGGGASATTIEKSSTKIKFSVPLKYGLSDD